MRQQLSGIAGKYPRQFWLMFWGLLLSASGTSMIWPFLLIYIKGKLDLPLTTISTLMTINAVCAVVSSFLAGPFADRFGRKGVMVISLFVDAVIFVLMIQASTYASFAVLMAVRGLSLPLYRIGADAMLADLIPPEHRIKAYSLIRTINNAGVAIGPAVGGFLASSSYDLAFYAAAASLTMYGILLTMFARETLDRKTQVGSKLPHERFGGYDRVLGDPAFVRPISMLMFGWITATLMWTLMPVYAKTNYAVPENVYGWIPTTNALMVVFLQVLVTRLTGRRQARTMMALGMLFYAIANGFVTLVTGFWGFWAAMVIMTIGELIIAPTSSTYVANIAPSTMRGRYMSIYGLTWAFGQGVGPVLGGLLNDNLGPHFIWVGGLTIGLISAFGLYLISRQPLSLKLQPGIE